MTNLYKPTNSLPSDSHLLALNLGCTPNILELRLAFIWTYTFDNFLMDKNVTTLYPFWGQPALFQQKFDEIQRQVQEYDTQIHQVELDYRYDQLAALAAKEQLQEKFLAAANQPGVLTLPWPWLGRRYPHRFWQYYLENRRPEQLSGAQAWEFLVPLRTYLPVRIRSLWGSEWPKVHFMLDGLFYPHGIALVLMPRLLFKAPAGQTPRRVMERALELRKEKPLPVTLPNGVEDELDLDALAVYLLNYLHQQVLGPHQPITTTPSEPLTVATVIRGQGESSILPPESGGEIHRVLDGLCSWNQQWQTTTALEPLTEANLLLGGRHLADFVHHRKRGRAVWMPAHFSVGSDPHNHALSCYHRNLTLLMLQTEMLTQAVARFMVFPQKNQKQKYKTFYELAYNATNRLSILYANTKAYGAKQTYNSASPRAYLEENGYIDLLNTARRHFELGGDLAYQPW